MKLLTEHIKPVVRPIRYSTAHYTMDICNQMCSTYIRDTLYSHLYDVSSAWLFIRLGLEIKFIGMNNEIKQRFINEIIN